jgi:tetratricopeptide (TPR) repeat protein
MSELKYNPDRTVEVIVYRLRKPPTYGTGYRIGGRLILTVAHIFPEGTQEIAFIRSRMRNSPEGSPWEEDEAPVIWCDNALDAALVLLPEKDLYHKPEPVKLGYFPPELSGETLPFQMFGFPTWAITYDVDGSPKAEGRQIKGEIAVSDYSSRDLLVLEPSRVGDDWRGMSGAAVFCQGYLIGVQIEHQRADRPESLSAQSIEKLLQKPEFADLLQAHGFDPSLHPIPAPVKIAVPVVAEVNTRPRVPPSVDLIGRDDLIEKIKQDLLNFDPTKPVILLQTPGIGKSELSKYVLNAPEIHKHFPDGVLWVSLGKKPNATQELINWAVQLNVASAESHTDDMRSNLIRNRIGEQKMVIFIDDVWDPQHLSRFQVGGPNCATIITTRRASVFNELVSAVRYELGALSEEDGFALLKRLAPQVVEKEPDVAQALVHAVGGVPFTLVLIAKHLMANTRGGDSRLRNALEKLRNAENRLSLKESLTRSGYDAPLSLQASIKVSEDELTEETRKIFHLASIFRAKPKPFSVAVLMHICQGLDEFADYETDALKDYLTDQLYLLYDEGLIEFDSEGDPNHQDAEPGDIWAYEQGSEKFTMSQIIADYAYLQLDPEDATQLHIAAAEYYQSCLFNYEENRTGEPSPYERMYAYEDARWQQVKASWLHHLSFTDDFHVNMAFTQLYFDAFYWWGEYLENRPFCDEVIEEWNARYFFTPNEDRTWLDVLEKFHTAYPAGYKNKNSLGDWPGVQESLLALRKLGGFDGDLSDFAEDSQLRHLRVLTDIYLAEARRYQDLQGPDAEAYLDEALSILEEDAAIAEADGDESDDSWIIPWVYWQKADLFLSRGDLDQALQFTEQVKELSLDLEEDILKLDLEIIGNAFRVEGDVSWEREDYAKAFQLYAKAMFCAWGFHCAGGATLDFYTVAYHHEMMERIESRLKELLWGSGLEGSSQMCTYLRNFWDPYVPMQPIEDVLALLQSQEWNAMAGYIFPPAPTADEVEAGADSDYCQRVFTVFPEMAKAVFAPRPFLSPLPPSHFVGRTTYIDAIKERLQAGDKQIVLGQSPGIGKTALAAFLTHDPDLRAYFQGGVLWAGLGQAPNISALIGEWLLVLGLPFEQVMNLESDLARKESLARVIGRRRMLLVLDDAWEESDLECFMLDSTIAPNCAYLITTRRKGLIESLQASEPYLLPILSKEEGLQLLSALAPEALNDHAEDAEQLVMSAGGMPLALVLMGKYLRSQSRGGQRRRAQHAIEKLRDEAARLELETVQSPLYQPEGPLSDVPLSLLAMLSVNYSELDESAQRAFLTLSIHKPKPSVFTDDFRKAMGVDDADFEQLLECGLIDEARLTAEDVSFYEGYETGYSSKMGQEMAQYEAEETFYEIVNIVKDFSRIRMAELFDASLIRDLHRRAAEYYSQWLKDFENNNSDATPYERMYRYVWPRWQFVMGQLIDHLGEVDPHSAEMQFATLYFDAFWWWGNYLEFPFCEQLLKWGEQYHHKADWVWMDYVVRFHEAYPTGYTIHYDYEDKDRWHEVQKMLEALSAYAEANRPAELTDAMKAQYQHLRMVISIFMAEAFQYQDVHDPRAEEYYQQALVLIDHNDKDNDDFWNIPWLYWHLSTLYLQQGHDAEAQAAAHQALEWAVKEIEAPCQRDNEVIANAYRVLADVLFRAEDYESAFTHYGWAVFYAWGFHACPNTPNFYSLKFHDEMLQRVGTRLRQLKDQSGFVVAEQAYQALCNFWQGVYEVLRDEPGLEGVFRWETEGDLEQFLGDGVDAEVAPHLSILPALPSKEAINAGLDSTYYQLTRKGFLSRV